MGLYGLTIYSIAKRNARIYANNVAWMSAGQKITYRQYLEKVDRLAFGLLNAGLEKGDRIGVLAENSLEFIYLFGACAKIGAIMVPFNWRLSQEEIEYIISDACPKLIFAGPEFQTMITRIISKFDFIKKVYALGQAKEDFAFFNDLIESDEIDSELAVHADDAYVIIYSAAVAGKPKGVILTHHNIITSNIQFMYAENLSKKDVQIILLPLFHIGGLGAALSLMQAGGLNIILPKFDVDLALKHIQEDKVTIFTEFPPILKNILDKTKDDNYDLSSLRIVTGLESPDIAKRLEETTRATLWIGYGQSETTGIIIYAPYFERLGSAGLPGILADVEIVDDYGNTVKAGQSGEIVVRGPIVFKGYWNKKEETDYTFRDGWHHTGDIGRFDADGYLWYIGRKAEKELIKTGGENVYPAEVEKVILEHPLIDEVVVIGVPDSQWGEAIKAVCVLKKGESLDENELIEFVGARIARFKKPKYVVFASILPHTTGGEVDRNKVKVSYGTNNNSP